MTDVEYLLKQDIREKKSTGRGIYGKRNGSKTKFCGLPHDNLTPAQLKRRNGPVITYTTSRRLTFTEFKALPLDLKHEYLTKLSETYGASQTMVAESLSVSPSHLCKYLKDLHLRGILHPTRTSSKPKLWDEFLAGRVSSSGVILTTEEPVPAEAPEPSVPAVIKRVFPETGHLGLKGTLDTLDINALLKTLLKTLLEENKTYLVAVSFKPCGGDADTPLL